MSVLPIRLLFRAVRSLAELFAKATVKLEWLLARLEIKANPKLWRIYTTFRQSPEAGWTIMEDDVVRLYQLIRSHRPRNILELGTGIGLSTAVMAAALERNGGGSITSLEQLTTCIAMANALIAPELKQYVHIIHARPVMYQLDGVSRWMWFSGYDWTPPPGERYDFVFIDGPAGWLEAGELVSLDSGDIFRLLPHLRSGCGVYVDGRRSLVKKIIRYLGRYLRFVERTSEFALFERTDQPAAHSGQIEITDAKRAVIAMREMKGEI